MRVLRWAVSDKENYRGKNAESLKGESHESELNLACVSGGETEAHAWASLRSSLDFPHWLQDESKH